jgi:hypothetical protein
MEDLDPLFMTNKNLSIRKTPQTVVETPFDKVEMNATGNPDKFE